MRERKQKPTRKEYIVQQKNWLQKKNAEFLTPTRVLSLVGKYYQNGLLFNEIAYIFDSSAIGQLSLDQFCNAYGLQKMTPTLDCRERIPWSEESYDRFEWAMIKNNSYSKTPKGERPYRCEI